MVLVARQLQTLKQSRKVNIPLARVEMHLAVTEVIGQAYCTDARDSIGRIDSWPYPLERNDAWHIQRFNRNASPLSREDQSYSKYGRRPRLTATIA